MQNYYIFLDIDGVLYDWQYLQTQPKTNGIIRNFNPQSVSALNYLIDNLSREFNVTIVVTSTWRHNMQKTISSLKNNGVNIGKIKVDKIDSNLPESNRGALILNYLKLKQFANFVIIDDEYFDFLECNLLSHLIKTNIKNNSLNMNLIKNYLINSKNVEKIN